MDNATECLYEEYERVMAPAAGLLDYHDIATQLWLYAGVARAPWVAVCLVREREDSTRFGKTLEEWTEVLEIPRSNAKLVRRAIATHDAVAARLREKKEP